MYVPTPFQFYIWKGTQNMVGNIARRTGGSNWNKSYVTYHSDTESWCTGICRNPKNLDVLENHEVSNNKVTIPKLISIAYSTYVAAKKDPAEIHCSVVYWPWKNSQHLVFFKPRTMLGGKKTKCYEFSQGQYTTEHYCILVYSEPYRPIQWTATASH